MKKKNGLKRTNAILHMIVTTCSFRAFSLYSFSRFLHCIYVDLYIIYESQKRMRLVVEYRSIV